uniref:Uncharacterized protein n=1 Tax=Poecilia mexicana TaxID=48701 RepID=A0A3B3YAW2_9TELE
MEERADSLIPVKVEENASGFTLLYFHGDINSMVDEHFSRALGKASKASELVPRSKKIRKTVKQGEHVKESLHYLKTQYFIKVTFSHLGCCFDSFMHI